MTPQRRSHSKEAGIPSPRSARLLTWLGVMTVIPPGHTFSLRSRAGQECPASFLLRGHPERDFNRGGNAP